MKFSISNFKAIGTLANYQILPLTVLSGTNSSGKSSLIQFLLLLKQTIEKASSSSPLDIDGKLYSVRNYLDVIKAKNKSNLFSVSFQIEKKEFAERSDKVKPSAFDGFNDYTCEVDLTYDFYGDEIFLSFFSLKYIVPEKTNSISIRHAKNPLLTTIVCNNDYFINHLFEEVEPTFSDVYFTSIFPSSVDVTRRKKIEVPTEQGFIYDEITERETINVDSVKSFLEQYFEGLYYISAFRVPPLDSYAVSGNGNFVEQNGENVAQVLERKKSEQIEFNEPVFLEDGIKFQRKTTNLIDAVNFWICDVFKFGKKIYSKEVGDTFSVILINPSDIETTIKHVGFGVSQILPIIVQGLLLKSKETLIVEQPEIHLHPKIQSALFDFFYSLIELDRNVLVETHSDHLITRMRRRIAEDQNSELQNIVNLTFIEEDGQDTLFRTLNLNDYGTLTYFPSEFIERPELELKPLLRAQLKKRTKNRE